MKNLSIAKRLKKQRYKKPAVHAPLPLFAKALIALIVIMVGVMAGSFAYWQGYVAPFSQPACASYSRPVSCVDPFTTIWNGETNAPSGRNAFSPGPIVRLQAAGSKTSLAWQTSASGDYTTSTTVTTSSFPVTVGYTIVASVFEDATDGVLPGTLTVDDTNSDVFSQAVDKSALSQCGDGARITTFTAVVITTASITVSGHTNAVGQKIAVGVSVYSGANGVGAVTTGEVGNSANLVMTLTTLAANSFLVGSAQQCGSNGSFSVSPPQALRTTINNGGSAPSAVMDDQPTTTVGSYSSTYVQNSQKSGTLIELKVVTAGGMVACQTSCFTTITPRHVGDFLLVTIFTRFDNGNSYSITDDVVAPDTFFFGGKTTFNIHDIGGGPNWPISVENDWGWYAGGTTPAAPSPVLKVTVTRTAGTDGWAFQLTEFSGVSAAQHEVGCGGNSGLVVGQSTNLTDYRCVYYVNDGPFAADFVFYEASMVFHDASGSVFNGLINGTALPHVSFSGDGFMPGCASDTCGGASMSAPQPALSAAAALNVTNYAHAFTHESSDPVEQVVDSVVLSANEVNQCNAGYNCFHSKSGPNGEITLFPSVASAAVTETNSAVDMSVAVSKEIAYFEEWEFHQSFAVGQAFAWYLTLNGTITSDPSYSPLNDQSVGMLVIVYYEGSNNWNVDFYMRRSTAGTLLSNSGQGVDPAPSSCTASSTIYMCFSQNATVAPVAYGAGSAAYQLTSAVLNYTGGATSSGTTNSLSYVCFSKTALGQSCGLGGAGNVQIAINARIFNNYNFPWFNVQGTGYHVGFWAAKGANTELDFANCTSGFTNCANVISQYVPNPAIQNPQTAEGGFFGWLGTGLGAVGNYLVGAGGAIVNTVAGPVLNLGSSLLNALVVGISIAFTAYAQAFQFVMNKVGSIWGDPLLGDHILILLQGFIAGTLQVFAGVAAFVLWLFNFVFVVIPFLVGTFLSVFVSIALSVWIIVISLFPFIVAMGGLINMPIQSLFFFDYVFGLIEVCFVGVPGFFAWINFNIWFFTLGFRLYDWFMTKLLFTIRSIKQLIPVIG